jgi:formylglycine-generating enzyme required for sulfatase activity
MNRIQSLALVVLAGTAFESEAQQSAIESLTATGELIFRAATNSTVDHYHRVECAASLVSTEWVPARLVGGIAASKAVTNVVPVEGNAAFFRVVTTSNSDVFVDGAYMSIDLSGGTGATSYTVSYYPDSAAVPGGTTNDVYKTTKMLLRFIPRGTFTMGAPTNELGRYSDEVQHEVRLTKDFYIGVFEVTQMQWALVMGNWPSYFTNATYRDSRPVDTVSYYEIRENPTNGPISPNWPQSAQAHSNSFVERLRARTGLTTLDLPTESQWEYACRVGTAASLNSGCNLTNGLFKSDAYMDDVGRYAYNWGAGWYHPGCETDLGSATVGSYQPNAWGLYDMHGNQREWCLDWWGPYPAVVQDPHGRPSGSNRVLRGGSWGFGTRACRSAARIFRAPSDLDNDTGFRLACVVPADGA